MKPHIYRRIVRILASALVVGTLALLGLLAQVSAENEVARKANEAEIRARVVVLEDKVTVLEGVVAQARSANESLQSQVEGNLRTLQDIAFEQLKRNDGLAPVWADPRPGRRVYLTFDDGPSENTALILDALKPRKVKATFFVNGRPGEKALYQRIVREGHRLGNHTYSHDYPLVYRSVPAFVADIDKLDGFLGSVGVPATRLYRFPGGAKNETAARLGGPDLTARITQALADRHYRFFEWNVAVGEGESRAESGRIPSAEIRRSVVAQARAKRIAVVLLHDGPGHRSTALAVPGIVDDLTRLGFTFEVLP